MKFNCYAVVTAVARPAIPDGPEGAYWFSVTTSEGVDLDAPFRDQANLIYQAVETELHDSLCVEPAQAYLVRIFLETGHQLQLADEGDEGEFEASVIFGGPVMAKDAPDWLAENLAPAD